MIEEILDFTRDNVVTLEKINTTNDKLTMINPGERYTGIALVLDLGDHGVRLAIGGDNGMVTSLVKKIIYKSDTKLTFETLNSVYELTKEV